MSAKRRTFLRTASYTSSAAHDLAAHPLPDYEKALFSFETTADTFYICRKDRIYFSFLGSEIVGSDSTPEAVARRLSSGEQIALVSGIEITSLKIPADLKEWEKLD